jgi:transcriptional regulator with XRE-family HTH domain
MRAKRRVPLAEWRDAKVLSIRGLAQLSGVSTNTIMAIERGRTPYPATVQKLAKALGIEPADLFRMPPGNERG